ncbi:CD1247 N-terminal domain-containing protein [Sulfobacillus thermosulfidooxidans]|uniref:CD1247 N-terminal domain-containing protein n=1 Tax=Sulfobacillus thermosulfidooxidans TaxID=28034 RepID=UPI0006B4046B|nr:CD1247 N-terminal domain-containing protein [Sulfobacillus thermosulfidooxidans]
MADLRRKVSHLVGLAERYDVGSRSREGKIIEEMIDVLRDLALDVEEVSVNQAEMEDFLDELDEDLLDVEEEVYGDSDVDEDDTMTFDDDDDDTLLDDAFLDDDDLDEPSYIALECPVCHKESSYNEALFERDGIQLSCPHCGNVIYDSDEDCIIMEQSDDDDDEDDYTSYR